MGRVALLAMVFLSIISTAAALHTNDLKEEIGRAGDEISGFLSGTYNDDTLIVSGSQISLEDRVLFNMIKMSLQDLQGLKAIDDDITLSDLALSGKTLVLLGSEKTNRLSRELIDGGAEVRVSTYSPLLLGFATTKEGRKIMLIYSEKEMKNNENHAVSKSPFAQLMDKRYVPIAATTLSLLMLYLWSVLGKTIVTFANDFVSSKILGKATKDKKAKEKRSDVKLHEFFTRQEIAALMIAIFIFTLTMTWTWTNNITEFKKMFFINLVIVGAISGLREFFRQYFCYKHKVSTEYVVWPFGSFLTLASTYFGNTFSLASYTLSDEKLDDEKKLGKQSFIVSAMTFGVAIVAYLMNIFVPSLTLQMIFVYCIMMVFIEMFPLTPFAGKDIREWKFGVWLASYGIVIVSYICMNFTIYV